jgi:hypothetical protein
MPEVSRFALQQRVIELEATLEQVRSLLTSWTRLDTVAVVLDQAPSTSLRELSGVVLRQAAHDFEQTYPNRDDAWVADWLRAEAYAQTHAEEAA